MFALVTLDRLRLPSTPDFYQNDIYVLEHMDLTQQDLFDLLFDEEIIDHNVIQTNLMPFKIIYQTCFLL